MKPLLKSLIDQFPAVDRALAAAQEQMRALQTERDSIREAIYIHLGRPERFQHYRAADGSIVVIGPSKIGGERMLSVYVADVGDPNA